MLLANFNRKEHLPHRAVSLRQHGFLVNCISKMSDCTCHTEPGLLCGTALNWRMASRNIRGKVGINRERQGSRIVLGKKNRLFIIVKLAMANGHLEINHK